LSTGHALSENTDDELVSVARRYARILQDGPIGVFEVQLDGTIRFANAALARAAGFERQEAMIGENILQFYVDPEQRQRMLSELAATGVVNAFSVTLRARDGVIRQLLLSAMLDGDVLRGVSVDVTELHGKERELRAALELNRRVLEAMPGGVVNVGADGSVNHANAEALRVLGLSQDEVTRRYTRDFETETIHEDGSPCPVDHYPATQALVTGEQPPAHTIGIRRPDGSVSWAVFRAVPVRDLESGRVSSAVVTFLDVSQRKRAEERMRSLEEQVRQSQKLESLGLMAGGVAHDFNNLLAAIMGNARLARLELAKGGDAEECLAAVETATQRAAELTRQMLTFAGRGSVNKQSISLSSAVGEMAELLATVISKQATLRLDLEKVPDIEGDPAQIHQIVMNLILNASDSLEGPGAVRVHTGSRDLTRSDLSSTYLDDDLPEGQYVFLEVTDTGRGMDEATRRRVFDPFFTTKATGHGLGLAATLGIVRGHRGAIELSSTPGLGTTFRVSFPRSEQPVARSKPSTKGSQRRADGATVLVVDDEPIVRSVTQRLLEQLGFRVLSAPDGKSGIATFSAHRDQIRVVLLDLTLGDMSGLEAMAAIRKVAPAVPVVLASGYSAEDVSSALSGSDRVTFLQKPFTLEALLDAIERVRRA
jgi:PAS domain S-box-containing protein